MALSLEVLPAKYKREATPLDILVGQACLEFSHVSADTSKPEGRGSIPSAQVAERYSRAVIRLVRFCDLKARSLGADFEDPELAWSEVARDKFQYFGRTIKEMHGLKDIWLLDEKNAEVQRQAYEEMRQSYPDDDPADWIK